MLRRYLDLLNPEDQEAVSYMVAEFRLLAGTPISAYGTEADFTIYFDDQFELFVRNGIAEGMRVLEGDDLPQSALELPNLSWVALHDGIDPALLKSLPRLKCLDVMDDALPFTSALIDALKPLHLESLTVQRTGCPIPDSIDELTSLRSLDLSYNDLEEVPDTLYGMDHLTRLSLGYNRLRYFDPQWGDLKGLQVLSLRHNRLTTIHALVHLHQLRYLDVSFNRLKQIPTDLKYLKGLQKVIAGDNQP